jgi:hypothetical protein
VSQAGTHSSAAERVQILGPVRPATLYPIGPIACPAARAIPSQHRITDSDSLWECERRDLTAWPHLNLRDVHSDPLGRGGGSAQHRCGLPFRPVRWRGHGPRHLGWTKRSSGEFPAARSRCGGDGGRLDVDGDAELLLQRDEFGYRGVVGQGAGQIEDVAQGLVAPVLVSGEGGAFVGVAA